MIRLALSLVLIWLVLLTGTMPAQAEWAFPVKAKRILFLGDSITHAGHYVAWIETQLRLQGVEPLPEMINIGLGSETCSGLSEPAHPFPRPDVHERLDRALEKIQPDVVVACYGMNDGIYYPFSQERFQAYQDGINRLIKKVQASGARLVLMTPPPFDPHPLRDSGKLKPAGEKEYAYFAMYENYDEVLARYGKWILKQKPRVDMVIDLHQPMKEATKNRRKADPKFTFCADGIHPNKQGHRLLAEVILKAWGMKSPTEPSEELLNLITRRTALLHDAWLTEVGHKRPGVKEGLPLPEAQKKAQDLEAKIRPLVRKQRSAVSNQLHRTGSRCPDSLSATSRHPFGSA